MPALAVLFVVALAEMPLPRNVGLGKNPTNRDFYVRSWRTGRKVMQFLPASATFWPWCRGRLWPRKGDFRMGEAVMTKVLNDILLFSCIAAFVTGIVLAAASLLT